MRYQINKREYINLMTHCRNSAESYDGKRMDLLEALEGTHEYWHGEAADTLRCELRAYLESGEYDSMLREYRRVECELELLLPEIRFQMELQDRMSLLLSGQHKAEPEELYLDMEMQEEMLDDLAEIDRQINSSVNEAINAMSDIADIVDLSCDMKDLREKQEDLSIMIRQYSMMLDENMNGVRKADACLCGIFDWIIGNDSDEEEDTPHEVFLDLSKARSHNGVVYIGGEKWEPVIPAEEVLLSADAGRLESMDDLEKQEVTMEIALAKMRGYLDGKVSEEVVEEYIDFIVKEYEKPIAQISEAYDNNEYSRENELDRYIIAWCYYWNYEGNNNFYSDYKIRPEVVKAMIMEESTMGTNGDKNGRRDVMQCLFSGDYGLWILSGMDPYEKGCVYKIAGNEKKYVWTHDPERDDQEKIDEYADLVDDFNYDDNDDFETFGALKNVIETIGQDTELSGKEVKDNEDYTGLYYIQYDRVTPNLSIACGIYYLMYLSQKYSLSTEWDLVEYYNKGGKYKKTGEKYGISINENLVKMVDENGNVVSELGGTP